MAASEEKTERSKSTELVPPTVQCPRKSALKQRAEGGKAALKTSNKKSSRQPRHVSFDPTTFTTMSAKIEKIIVRLQGK